MYRTAITMILAASLVSCGTDDEANISQDKQFVSEKAPPTLRSGYYTGPARYTLDTCGLGLEGEVEIMTQFFFAGHPSGFECVSLDNIACELHETVTYDSGCTYTGSTYLVLTPVSDTEVQGTMTVTKQGSSGCGQCEQRATLQMVLRQ